MELQSRHSDTRSQSNDHGHGHESDHEPHEGPETQSQKLDRRSILKLVCAGFSFFFAGTNDGTTGPLLPYMLHEYNISTGLVTVIYVATFAGWFLSALTNTHLTTTLRLSLGATLLLGAGLQVLSQFLRFWNPPFGLFVVTFFLTALGQAYQDSYSNTYVATVPGAHRWLGFIHAMYMLGCLTGPFIATPLASHTRWHYTYAAEAGLGVLNLAFVAGAFGSEMFADSKQKRKTAFEAARDGNAEVVASGHDGASPESQRDTAPGSRNVQALNEIRQTLRLRAVWLVSMFFFFFLGAVITAGGWVVEYLVRVRKGGLSSMGYAPTGFYGGGFLGRLLLAEPTHRFGDRRMVFGYIVACIALQVMFWTIPNIVAGVVLYSALGFFSGPFFVSGISVASKLCPKSVQTTALGFIFVLAQAGGSLFPTLTGLVAAHAGVKVLQPILVALFVGTGVSWWLVPKVDKVRDVPEDEHVHGLSPLPANIFMGLQACPNMASSKTDRVVKKRASQACHNCRTRKVKCDLITSSAPCSNCRLDEVECVVVESKRSRKYRLQKRRLNGLSSLPPLTRAPPKLETRSSFASSNVAPEVLAHEVSKTVNAVSDISQGGRPEGGPLDSKASSTAASSFQGSPGSATPTDGVHAKIGDYARSDVLQCPPPVNLPSYIRAPRAGVQPEDIEILHRRGALSIPPAELRDQLLRSYVLFVYPYMPTIDLQDFLGALDGHEGCSKISLMVFQAVMFAGTAYVDLDLLQQAGYESRRAARSDMYQKVKLLYDFNWDVDRIALVQSLLLMNYWYVSENDPKDPWHWLGICISLATSIGMDQTDTYVRDDPRTRRLWRRIWWSCVMRDRIMAITMRRRMRIRDDEISLAMLSANLDFDLGPITNTMPALRECRSMIDSSVRKMLAEMYVAKTKLLLIVGDIINSCYSLRALGRSTWEVTMLYTPRRADAIRPHDLARLQDDLEKWEGTLPPSCWLRTSPETRAGLNTDTASPIDSGTADATTDDVLFLHRSVLKMLFLLATEALNRPQTLSMSKSKHGMASATDSIPAAGAGAATSTSASTLASTSTSKVKEAAAKMSEIVMYLQDRDLVKYLPPISVSFMLLAIAAFLVEEIKTTKGEPSQTSPDEQLLRNQQQHEQRQRQFQNCVRTLLGLRDRWPIADSACELVAQMMARSRGGTKPARGTGLSADRGKNLHGTATAAAAENMLAVTTTASQSTTGPAVQSVFSGTILAQPASRIHDHDNVMGITNGVSTSPNPVDDATKSEVRAASLDSRRLSQSLLSQGVADVQNPVSFGNINGGSSALSSSSSSLLAPNASFIQMSSWTGTGTGPDEKVLDSKAAATVGSFFDLESRHRQHQTQPQTQNHHHNHNSLDHPSSQQHPTRRGHNQTNPGHGHGYGHAHGHIANGHALYMDIALAECSALAGGGAGGAVGNASASASASASAGTATGPLSGGAGSATGIFDTNTNHLEVTDGGFSSDLGFDLDDFGFNHGFDFNFDFDFDFEAYFDSNPENHME
ncbi:Cutinase transcription factor 1 beta [Exophiala dermatitidis]